MDKYQENLLRINQSYYRLAVRGELGIESVLDNDAINVKQDEDITITDYTLFIANIAVEAVFAVCGKNKVPFNCETDPIHSSSKSENRNRFFYHISFENKIDSVLIVFKNNIADDLLLKVKYMEADKKAYYDRIDKQRKEDLLKQANVKCSTGADLVNIFFQPCCDKYAYTEILLYFAAETKNVSCSVNGSSFSKQVALSWNKIKKCKVDPEDFMKSITGLAYGLYSFILTQYNSDGNVLMQTDRIEFIIASNYGQRRPINIIH